MSLSDEAWMNNCNSESVVAARTPGNAVLVGGLVLASPISTSVLFETDMRSETECLL